MWEKIPREIKELSQWVCWRREEDPSRPGHSKKLPVNPRTGGLAQSNNPETWSTFEEAVSRSTTYDGIGFMFAGGYFGVDLDHVGDAMEDFAHGIDDNIVGEFVRGLQSYAEASISGEGVHIICRGSLPPKGRRKGNVEMYSEGRFFVMTGRAITSVDTISECTGAIRPLHEKYIGGGERPTTGVIPAKEISLDDGRVLELAEASKQGGIFRDLYAGVWEPYFTSQSEADMSLCNILAFWCRRDAVQMDRLFRGSGLMRPKWDRRQSGTTYGAITIQKAARDCVKIYEPPAEYRITIGCKPNGPPQDRPQKLYSFDDTGNAERFTDRFGDLLRYSFVDKKWLYYDGRKWIVDFSGAVRCLVDEVLEEMRQDGALYVEAAEPTDDPDEIAKAFAKHLKASRSSRAKTAMLTESQHRVPVLPHEMDANKDLLNVVNGVVRLRDGVLLDHDPKLMMSRISYTEYTDKMDHPVWDRFLEDIFAGDRELIHYVQKAVGYSLTGSTVEQCMFFLYGTGSNGKSTFMETIAYLLGDYAMNVQVDTLAMKGQAQTGPSSDIARLKGARLVTSAEPNEGMRLNESLVKQLTGGDRVTARKLFGEEFEYAPEFKLWIATNHKPVIRGTDDGIWRRLHMIPFRIKIPEEKKDKYLKHKLIREMPGILSWAVEGCRMWRQEGLGMPCVVEEAGREYRGEMDVLAAFLEACCCIGSGEERSRDLYAAYAAWAEEGNEYKMPSRKFFLEMGKRFEKKKGSQCMLYCGLSLLKEYRPYQIRIM